MLCTTSDMEIYILFVWSNVILLCCWQYCLVSVCCSMILALSILSLFADVYPIREGDKIAASSANCQITSIQHFSTIFYDALRYNTILYNISQVSRSLFAYM